MKWIAVAWFFVLLGVEARTLTFEKNYALANGALVRVFLKVVDDRGDNIAQATVMGNFHMNDAKGYPFKGLTDTHGVYMASGKCVGDWHYVVEKDGYYKTSENLDYFRLTNTTVRHGRWQPYGLTNTVVLKRKVNPVATYVHRDFNLLSLPKLNEWTGFDLEYADWIAPHGQGKRADFQVLLQCGETDKRGAFEQFALTFRFRNPHDGIYAAQKDNSGSELKTAYKADVKRTYETEMIFSYDRIHDLKTDRIVIKDQLLQTDQYLVLRVRSVTDPKGNLVQANYAKIYAPLFAAFYGFKISTYFNPNVNDPSLEADTTRNLLNPHDLGFPP